ncbi:MAG: hypothetical protein Q9187_008133, partial [Circinaria calcarea]
MTRTKQWQKAKPTKRQKVKPGTTNAGSSNEDILLADVRRLISTLSLGKGEKLSGPIETGGTLTKRFSEIEVKISEISSTGDGLGFAAESDHVYVVPFTAPGDLVRAKVVNYNAAENYTLTDFVEVIEPSPQRDDARIGCRYFAKCSGCQLQMLSYEDQLAHKKTIIERAYKNFSTLAPESIPSVGDTIGSPLQYGYRTKLTPHFDQPRGNRNRNDRPDTGETTEPQEVPDIGFMYKNRRKTLDIEDCPIGTDAVRKGMKSERERVAREIRKYKRGATLLLRESTSRTSIITPPEAKTPTNDISHQTPTDHTSHQLSENIPSSTSKDPDPPTLTPKTAISSNSLPHVPITETKTCITDSNATATEYIDSYIFTNTAGAFFQNNNSILPRFTAYIRQHILPPPSARPVRHLIDAYCGSGLFTITLSSLFASSTGIDISPLSITAADKNAAANRTPNATFMTADASALFQKVTYPPDETVVVIDPPRKGCDDEFLSQLLRFGPRRVVYVSCNVHTQARDVGVLVEGKGGA